VQLPTGSGKTPFLYIARLSAAKQAMFPGGSSDCTDANIFGIDRRFPSTKQTKKLEDGSRGLQAAT